MTRGEALSYAYALKHNYTVDLNKMPDFAQSIIYLLSFEPCDDCISREGLLNAITEIDGHCNMDVFTNEVREIVNELPSIQPISNDTCSTCKFASIHCTEHDMDVAATDGCADWEE